MRPIHFFAEAFFLPPSQGNRHEFVSLFHEFLDKPGVDLTAYNIGGQTALSTAGWHFHSLLMIEFKCLVLTKLQICCPYNYWSPTLHRMVVQKLHTRIFLVLLIAQRQVCFQVPEEIWRTIFGFIPQEERTDTLVRSLW